MMLALLLMFALGKTSHAADRPCPPAGFEPAAYVRAHDAEAPQPGIERQLAVLADNYWNGPAGKEGRPASLNVDLYVQPNGDVAAVCVVSGERHVIAAVAKSLAQVKLPPMGRQGPARRRPEVPPLR